LSRKRRESTFTSMAMAAVPRTTAMAPVAGGLSRALRKGDKVQAWSGTEKQWLDGSIEDIIEEPCSVGAMAVQAGSAKVQCTKGLRFIPPDRSKSLLRLAASVVVVAPGAGTGINSEVYKALGEDRRFKVKAVGKKGEAYDRYPEYWEHGAPAPNLETFAADVLDHGLGDVLVLGSRGGQVVLPCLWRKLGSKVPPAVVINGGCAMNLPGPAVSWPLGAVTLLLMGGEDFFKGKLSSADYIASSKKKVPAGNSSTAIVYVRQMQHMPQRVLLSTVLDQLLLAALAWKASGRAPEAQLSALCTKLEGDGWTGTLAFTASPGVWKDLNFGKVGSGKSQKLTALADEPTPTVEVTREAELRALWQAAAADVVIPTRLGAPSSKELALSAAAAANGHREAAAQARQIAQVQASKAQGLEAEIVRREEELRELRQKLAEVRKEELRLVDLAEAQDAEAVAAEADVEEAVIWSAENSTSVSSGMHATPQDVIQPLGARVLVASHH